MVAQLELVAMAVRPDLPSEDSMAVFFARSILAFGVFCSLRGQDIDELKPPKPDEDEAAAEAAAAAGGA